MNRLRIASQGYESLASALNLSLDESVSDRVEQWLTREVCPLVEELAASRAFRSTTLWSVEHLSSRVQTPERHLVADVDRELKAFASAIYRLSVVNDEADIPDKHPLTQFSRRYQDDVKYIADQPWFDLVCEGDFFGPSNDLFLKTDCLNRKHTSAFQKTELHIPLGDYVTRLLLARVDYWKATLERIANAIPREAMSGQDPRFKVVNHIFERRIALDEAMDRLSRQCLDSGPYARREACTALTLIYAAYSPSANLRWLGVDESEWKVAGRIIRSWVRRPGTIQTPQIMASGAIIMDEGDRASLCDPDVIRQIASSLQEMTTFYGVPDDPREIIRDESSRARLVLIDCKCRAVVFDGTAILAGEWDKNEKSWDLLWTLANNPKQPIDHEMISSCRKSNFRSRRKRLSKLLMEGCPELDTVIDTDSKNGYVLDLNAEEIALLQDDNRGSLQIVSQKHNLTF